MCRINGLRKLGKEKIFEAGKQKIELIFFFEQEQTASVWEGDFWSDASLRRA